LRFLPTEDVTPWGEVRPMPSHIRDAHKDPLPIFINTLITITSPTSYSFTPSSSWQHSLMRRHHLLAHLVSLSGVSIVRVATLVEDTYRNLTLIKSNDESIREEQEDLYGSATLAKWFEINQLAFRFMWWYSPSILHTLIRHQRGPPINCWLVDPSLANTWYYHYHNIYIDIWRSIHCLFCSKLDGIDRMVW
jgi:hypothetical protein